MFSKSQREALNTLSRKVYGIESGWVKLLNDPKYQIATGQRETNDQRYVQYRNKDGKPGTVVTIEKAMEKFGFQPTEEQLAQKTTIVDSRSATFEELMNAMQAALEVGVHSQLDPDGRQHVFAHMFASGKLVYKLSLELGDSEQTKVAFGEQLALLSEEMQNSIKGMLTSADNPTKGVPVDAYGFVSDVVFCKNHEEKAAELTHSYLTSAAEKINTPKKNLNDQLQRKMYNEYVNKAKREKKKKQLKKQEEVRNAKSKQRKSSSHNLGQDPGGSGESQPNNEG